MDSDLGGRLERARACPGHCPTIHKHNCPQPCLRCYKWEARNYSCFIHDILRIKIKFLWQAQYLAWSLHKLSCLCEASTVLRRFAVAYEVVQNLLLPDSQTNDFQVGAAQECLTGRVQRECRNCRSVWQECLRIVSHNNLFQKCLTQVSYRRVSHKSVLQRFPACAPSCKSVCLTGVSHESVSQDCLSRESDRSVPTRPHKRGTPGSFTRLLQQCLTKVSHRSVTTSKGVV